MSFPTAFTYVSGSPNGLAVNQGVTFNPDLTRFWTTESVPGAGSGPQAIYEYDADYNFVATSGTYGVAHGLPASAEQQVNGIIYWPATGKLYCGYNNYDLEPAGGGIFIVDPADLTVIEVVHPATNGHVEGCAIRNTQRGPEAFVFTNSGTTIERYDLATWTLQGTHDFGYWAVGDPAAVYQGGGWFGNVLCLGLHGNQLRPPTIDACVWDDDALEFTPLYRMTRPTLYSGQGFNFTADLAHAVFAERNIIPTPDEYRIVRADVSSVDVLPYGTPNGTSSQFADLEHWYQRLAWNAGATELQLPDTMGNGPAGTGFDGTRVYPIVDVDGTRKIRFDGADGSGIALGNVFGAAGWALATIWFRGVVVHREDANDTLLSWDATGTNLGDGTLEVNRTSARSVSFRYTTAANGSVTLTSAGAVFTLGVPFDLCVTLTASGARIYVDGVQVATNATAGQIGGASQDCFLGSNYLGAVGAEFDAWDVRLYDAVKDPAVLATYDIWTDGSENMGTLSSYLLNESLDHLLNVGAWSAPATVYFAAFVAGVEVSGGAYARKAETNNTTLFPNAAGRAKTNGTPITWVTASGANWGTIDEIRIYDASSGGNELARDALASSVVIDDGDTLQIAAGALDITAPAGMLTDAHVHLMLNHAFGAVAWTAQASTQFAYFVGDPQGAGVENVGTGYARDVNTSNGTTWGAASGGMARNLIDFQFPTAGAGDWDACTYWALYDNAGTGLMMSAALPATRTVANGETEVIGANRLRLTLA